MVPVWLASLQPSLRNNNNENTPKNVEVMLEQDPGEITQTCLLPRKPSSTGSWKCIGGRVTLALSHIVLMLRVLGTACDLILRAACLFWMPPPPPQVQKETWRVPRLWSPCFQLLDSCLGLSIRAFLQSLMCLQVFLPPLNLPGARLSSRLLAKRHLLKYSSAEIVPWVLFPIGPVVCH